MNEKKSLLDVKIEIQLILQLLIQEDVVTEEEISDMRNKVKSSANYKLLYDYFEKDKIKMNYYKKGVSDYFDAKMNGTIK